MVEGKATNMSHRLDEDEDGLDEEPGEVIDSAPPLEVGEEREINSSGLKKKLLRRGLGWDTPEFGDEVTVHNVGTLLDGTKFVSTRDKDKPSHFKLGHGQVAAGLDHAIITMTKGEMALFTLPPEFGYGATGKRGFRPNCVVQFEVELISWITVIDVCKDGGIIKRVMEKGEQTGPPGDLDEVLVKYQVRLDDGATISTTPEGGVEFYVKDGHFCPALPRALKTMRRGEKANLIIQPQYAFEERDGNSKNEFPLIPPSSVLNIDLELVSFKPVIDVTGDSKVIKKILKEGEGTLTANEGAAVSMRYTAMLEDCTIFEKKGIDEGPLEFITDEEQVIVGLDRAAATMKKREQAIVTITSEYGFGSTEVKCDLAVVPPNSTLVYQVEMLDFVKVLDVEFYNVKALYRRAQAYMETADLHLAELDIKKALEADPQNREVKLIQKNLKQLQAESNKRDAKLYSNMFARMTKDSSVATKRLKVEKVEDDRKDEEVMAMEMEKVAVSSAPPPLDKDMVVDSS